LSEFLGSSGKLKPWRDERKKMRPIYETVSIQNILDSLFVTFSIYVISEKLNDVLWMNNYFNLYESKDI